MAVRSSNGFSFFCDYSVWVGRSSQICAAAIYDSLVIGECLRIEKYIGTDCSVPLTS